MSDIQHEKFTSLMAEVETLEDQLDTQQKEGAPPEVIAEIQDKLAEARHRLRQLSDGCGTGHSHLV